MLFSKILETLPKYGYIIVSLLVLVEGPVVTISSSFLASFGYFNIFVLYPLIVAADVFADVLWYFVGYLGRERIINRWGRFVGLTQEKFGRLARIENKFKANQGKILFTAKITHAVGFPFLITAGILKVDLKKYILFNFLAALPKTLIFMVIGYYFGEAGEAIGKYLRYSTYIGISLFVIAVAVFFILQKYSKKLFQKYEE
jgi:membrane-associated protein